MMTSEITDEMVASAHAEYCHTGSDTRWNVRMRRAIQAALAARPNQTSGLGAKQIEKTSDEITGSVVDDLREYARVGAGSKHHCQVQEDAADLIQFQAERIDRLKKALREIRDAPCMDPEGNSAIARAALQQEGE